MATYALTYATRAAFDSALASGDIYTLMQGVTSSQPSVAIAAHITESGETFSCGTNVMVDIKSVGPGDYVLYDTTNKKFFGIASKWIDNNYPDQPTQHILIFKAGVLPARFVVCGTVIKRFGNRIRIAGTSSSQTWAGGNWGVSAIATYSTIIKKNGAETSNILSFGTISFADSRYHESRYPTGNTNYLPILRSTWDSAVAAGDTTVTENGRTITLADFKNRYDIFLAWYYEPKFPVNDGVMQETDGFDNTQKIVADFIENHSKTSASVDYAAGYCYNHMPSNSVPGLEKHAWFLGTVKDVIEIRSLSYTLMSPIAWGNDYLQTSSQFNANQSWVVDPNGATYNRSKSASGTVVPIADLFI